MIFHVVLDVLAEQHGGRISPRALIADGPVTIPVAREDSAPRVLPPPPPTTPLRARVRRTKAREPSTVLYWKAAVVAACATVAATLVLVWGSPEPEPPRSEPLAAVGAAAPQTATALEVAAAPDLPDQPQAAKTVAPAQADPFVEEIVFIEDDDDQAEGEPVETTSRNRVARRARARDVARAQTKRARLAKALGDRATAERLYKDALAALPTYAPAAADLATLCLKRGDYDRGLTYARRALRSAPRKLAYMVLVGDAYHLLGRDADARRMWKMAAEYGSAKAERRLAR